MRLFRQVSQTSSCSGLAYSADFRCDQHEGTALMYTADGARKEVCAWLADRGADSNVTDEVSKPRELCSLL